MKEGSKPSFPCVHAEKKIQIVGGTSDGGHQIYTSWSQPSAESPPHFPAETEQNDQLDGAAAPKPWRFQDPDTMRRKRVAKYKGYAIAGRVKASIRMGVGWIKNKCTRVSHDY
ncbi:hypothetical protein F511_26428 [Dorcoceras hygrometricum]|uniref:Uncharacterized protein n=1 Tax=Dorcoceras hygrometricum TaxID=472368 RepID=A0A2Z7CHM5_9LAMI|nr:hypothetical protein F511_26428 [Dorcoceras hygrometricum]